MRKIKKLLTLAAAAALLVSALAVTASASGFPDVSDDAWYAKNIGMITSYNPDIIGGYADGTFRPGELVTRGEFLKMASMASDFFTVVDDSCRVHWAAKYYKMARENGALTVDPSYGRLLFECTPEVLDGYITRGEMAVIVSNICEKTYRENEVTLTSPEKHLSDYYSVHADYMPAVLQSYGKGILVGYDDGAYHDNWNLTRAEAATVIYRMLWSGDRKIPSYAKEVPLVVGTDGADWVSESSDFVSFATRYKSMTDAERRTALFGDANKTYFASAAEAAPYLRDITVPVWKVDRNGAKYSSTITLTVHYLVADELSLIFQEIYSDPEQFPICSWGGARFTDRLRHAWGCAIDLNADQNCYCNVSGGSTRVLAGSGWWPGTNQYSFTADCSVVRIFAKYGWGWGGQGYSGGYYDYMHFSILSSGG